MSSVAASKTMAALCCLIAWHAASGEDAERGDPGQTAARVAQLVAEAGEDRRAGRHRLALERLLTARRLAEAAGQAELADRLAAPLAQSHLYAGQMTAARAEYQRARIFAARNDDVLLAAGIDNDLGHIAVLDGRPDEAQERFASSAEQAATGRDRLAAATARLNLAQLELARGQRDRAARQLAEAEAALAAVADSPGKLQAVLRAATLAEAFATPAEAARLIETAGDLAARLGDLRGTATVHALRAQHEENGGRIDQALLATRHAIFIAQTVPAADLLFRFHAQSGRLLAKRGQRDEAIRAYQRAAEILRSVEPDLMAESRIGGESYRELAAPVLQHLGDLLLRRAAAGTGTSEQDLLLARDAIERLRTVELQDYFQDQCVAAARDKRREPAAAVAGTAVLYPILLPDRVELIVTLPDGLRQLTLPVSGGRMTAEARKLRQLLEKRTTHEYLLPARQIYQWLIRPLEQALAAQSVTTIVVIPDGALRNVPFAALHDGRQFLIERFAIAVAPAVNLVEPSADRQTAQSTLLSGISEAVEDFPPLPFVASELDSLSSRFGGTLLKDGQFLLARFAGELQRAPYGVVHIASHGQIDANPRRSFVLAHDGRLTMDRLEELVKFSRLRAGALDLVVLSACRTAAGDDRAALGLAGMAVKAGARSAVASLWYVNDEAASAIVGGFYDALGTGAAKAVALQTAQRRLLAEPRFRHPLYWSPFVLVGNWQ